MKPIFLDRAVELNYLDNLYKQSGFKLVVIYGRRRVGKTELIKQFIKDRNGNYLLLTNESLYENIKELKRLFARILAKEHFTELSVDNLFDLFKYFKQEVNPNEKIIIALDEFPYLLDINRGILSTFQKIIDELLKETNIMLVLSGSSMSIMEGEVLGYRTPLYGRQLNSWKLQPLSFSVLLELYEKIELALNVYFVYGSIPYYFLFFDKDKSFLKNISSTVLTKGYGLYEEPLILLRQEFRQEKTYKLLLKYISQGYRTIGKLCAVTGLDKSNISKYLDTLVEVGLIRHIIPFGMKRKGIFEIVDPFIDFWFKYVYVHRSELELGDQESTLKDFKKSKEQHFGKKFEYLVEDLIRQRIFPQLICTSLSKWWHKNQEIDIIGSSLEQLLFVECKWKSRVNAEKIALDLLKKTEVFPTDKNKVLAIFAKSFSRRIDCIKGVPVQCFDLSDIESNLQS
jgi:AAA+ ATPase superfamily predicted ATPase